MTWIEQRLGMIFLVVGVPMVLFFALAVPFLQVPDEGNHLLRADQVARGEWRGHRVAGGSGGTVGTDAVCFLRALEKGARAGSYRMDGRTRQEDFANTVLYGPCAYLPQAATLVLARWRSMPVGRAFLLVRLVNAGVGLAIGALAIGIARRGRFLVFLLLSMPMSLFLMGSASQDALLVPMAALFVALAVRGHGADAMPCRWRHPVVLALLLAVLAMGRLPWLCLGGLLLVPERGMLRREFLHGIAATCVAALATLAWVLACRGLSVPMRAGVDAVGQLAYLQAHLRELPAIAIRTLESADLRFTIGGMFGSIGVYDSALPLPFYGVALLGCLAALVLDAGTDAREPGGAWRAMAMLVGCCGCAAIYAAIYLTWCQVGARHVEGVQGRYLTPFLLAVGTALPLKRTLSGVLWRGCALLVVAVPFVGAVTSLWKVLSRYYG